jgi:hypothetical protein
VKLIPNWRNAWRMFSMQALTVAATMQAVWLELPAEVKAELPQGLVHYLTLAALVVAAVGRVVKQSEVHQ